MKKLVLIGLIVTLAISAFSQGSELYLRKNEGVFYIEHQVVSKDNFYSVGRLYNVSARYIANFNKIDMNKGLDIGQKLRIPLTDTNFTMTGNSGTPVYYKAGLNTTLTRISDAYRNVPVANLKYWNKRLAEEVVEGEKLIIGFLKSEKLHSITLDHPAPQKEELSKTEPVTVTVKNEEEPEDQKEKSEGTVKGEPNTSKAENDTGVVSPGGYGYFKASFETQSRSSSGVVNRVVSSGVFKTSSGWEDGKYYVLVDNVEPGTIVKLINPGNNEVVYAKVLGELSSIRMNQSLDVRISNAAASVLRVGDTDKFILKITY